MLMHMKSAISDATDQQRCRLPSTVSNYAAATRPGETSYWPNLY